MDVRTEHGVTVECLKCGHVGFLSLKALSRCRADAQHANRSFRQTSSLSPLRQPERACHSRGFATTGGGGSLRE